MTWRKVKESNPRDVLLGLVFKTSCAPLRATFRILAGTLRFELRTSILETDGLPVSLHPYRIGACGRTRTYEVRTDARSTVECFCCSATHAEMNFRFQIPDSISPEFRRFQNFKISNSRITCGIEISDLSFTVLKNR